MNQTQRTIKLSQIDQGSNPRTYFDENEFNELVESIKANGVMQPIMVRPIDNDRFSIIAGERRWRASKVAFGNDGDIPVIIRVCSDEEADVLALVENTARANMSATEEAKAAEKILRRVKGNKIEAAALLGWSITKLERRVALTRLTDEVCAALNERKILLGHAELLAAIPENKQNQTLEKIITHSVSVSQVKVQLSKLAQALKDAVFVKDDCANCEFNSECQSALFGETIGNGYCTNPVCFSEKTEAFIDGIAVQLREEAPRVEVVRAASSIIPIKLVAEGKFGVGEAQANACKSCANFGCTVSALPGTIGDIEKEICFDGDCNTIKVMENLKNEESVKVEVAKVIAAVKANGGNDEQAASAGAEAAKTKKKEAKAKAKGVVSQRVIDYRLNVWRKVAAKAIFAKPELATCVMLALALSGKARLFDTSKLNEGFKRLNGEASDKFNSLGEVSEQVLGLTNDGRSSLLSMLAPSAMKQCDDKDIRSTLKFMQVDFGAYWKIDEEFLKLLTKSEIESLAEEIGLIAAMGSKEFNKAATGKRDEFIKILVNTDKFNFTGVVPNCMNFEIEKMPDTLATESSEPVDSQGDDENDAGESNETDEQSEEETGEEA